MHTYKQYKQSYWYIFLWSLSLPTAVYYPHLDYMGKTGEALIQSH